MYFIDAAKKVAKLVLKPLHEAIKVTLNFHDPQSWDNTMSCMVDSNKMQHSFVGP
jgi:hypothetical protein